MTNEHKHYFWNKDFPKAEKVFSSYYFDGAAQDIADTDEGVIDIALEWNGRNFVQDTYTQLQELINSDMEDDELHDFIHDKLGSAYVAEPGKSRKWLIRICKIIENKTKL